MDAWGRLELVWGGVPCFRFYTESIGWAGRTVPQLPGESENKGPMLLIVGFCNTRKGLLSFAIHSNA